MICQVAHTQRVSLSASLTCFGRFLGGFLTCLSGFWALPGRVFDVFERLTEGSEQTVEDERKKPLEGARIERRTRERSCKAPFKHACTAIDDLWVFFRSFQGHPRVLFARLEGLFITCEQAAKESIQIQSCADEHG